MTAGGGERGVPSYPAPSRGSLSHAPFVYRCLTVIIEQFFSDDFSLIKPASISLHPHITACPNVVYSHCVSAFQDFHPQPHVPARPIQSKSKRNVGPGKLHRFTSNVRVASLTDRHGWNMDAWEVLGVHCDVNFVVIFVFVFLVTQLTLSFLCRTFVDKTFTFFKNYKKMQSLAELWLSSADY